MLMKKFRLGGAVAIAVLCPRIENGAAAQEHHAMRPPAVQHELVTEYVRTRSSIERWSSGRWKGIWEPWA